MQDPLRKLLWVLAISLAAHLALLFGPQFSLHERPAPAPLIEARLEKTPAPVPPEAVKPVLPRPKKLRPPVAKPKAAPVMASEAETSAPEVAPEPVEPPPAESPQAAAEPVQEEEPAPAMPRQVAIRYTVFKGQNGLSVGRAEQVWKLDGNRYTITSVAEATGLFSLFASGRHIQESRGEMTSTGLKPSLFRVERGQAAEKTDVARFDWSAMKLSIDSGGEQRELKLPEGAQDILSMMYQLAYLPPQRSSVQMQVTNGRKLDSYSYWVVEEALDTQMGKLKTLHLGKQHDPGEKDTEVWLAADHHYLPVKISQVDGDGDGLVLLANEIAVTQ